MSGFRIAAASIALVLSSQLPRAVSQENPFVQFTVSGTFDNSDKLPLTGWFIVNQNNGVVVRADMFHGSRELFTLTIPGASGDLFWLNLRNTATDSLNILLYAPGNDGSLAGYKGGAICSNLAPECIGSSFFDGSIHSYYGEDLVYVGSVSRPASLPAVTIALRPHGEGAAQINPRSHVLGTIAILSTTHLNAFTQVDTGSLTFGPTGAEQSIVSCNKDPLDINNDGLPDLICHFNPRLTQFLPSESLAILIGKTLQGSPFVGTEKVHIKPLESDPRR